MTIKRDSFFRRRRTSAIRSVHAPLGGYARAFLVFLFASLYLLYLEYFVASAAVLLVSFALITLLALTDKIVFDGRKIWRTGLVPLLLSRSDQALRLKDFENVETRAIRTFKRGGRVHYKFVTFIAGNGAEISIVSMSKRNRSFLRIVLAAAPEHSLDIRSLELRNYLAPPADVLRKALDEHIPASDVLESSLFGRSRKLPAFASDPLSEPANKEKAQTLRRLGNELKVAGLILRSLEAFRRAIRLDPGDGWILFDCARCLGSTARAKRDPKLERKALALMKLAERRAERDPLLLTRLGENYFRLGYWKKAGQVFGRVRENFGESFNLMKGFAGLALREGKIAHVIHNFEAAARVAPTRALKRWSQSELEYFSNLNRDEEYMELELSRVNLVDTLRATGRSALRISLLGGFAVICGLMLEMPTVSNFGWGVAIVAILLKIVAGPISALLSSRIPIDSLER